MIRLKRYTMKKMFIPRLFFLFFLSATSGAWAELVKITPSEVYGQVMQLNKEVDLLTKHFGLSHEKKTDIYRANLLPRHVWVKAYVIMVKINVLRNKIGLPRNQANYMEPELNPSPALVFEQIRRLTAELRILKKRLGIKGWVGKPEQFSGKRPIDVFNRLHHISCQLDALNEEEINPNYVFAEVMRIHEDIVSVLRALRLRDKTYPPGKEENMTPADSLKAVFALLAEIQRLQKNTDISRTDFSAFQKEEKSVPPSDVFNMVGMCLAEIQTLKAHIGLKHNITVPAAYHQGKSTADVHQLLRWTTRMFRQVRQL